MADLKAQRLLKQLVKIQNRSGSMKAAPHQLMKLKEGIQKVPFQLLSPGMSQIVNSGNLVKMIQKLAPQLGGLNQLGQFKNLLAQAGGTGSINNIQSIASRIPTEKLVEALGEANALGMSLMAGLSDSDQKEIDDEAPKNV